MIMEWVIGILLPQPLFQRIPPKPVTLPAVRLNSRCLHNILEAHYLPLAAAKLPSIPFLIIAKI